MPLVKDPADPNRCKGNAPDGQCRNVAMDGLDYCKYHSGSLAKQEKIGQGIYNLSKARYRSRLGELKEHEQIVSLREEIALTRLLIEERFNNIKNDADLLAAYSTVNSLVLTLERLIKTSHHIEQQLGTLLSKPSVLVLGQVLVQIVGEELQNVPNYEDVVDRLGTRIFHAIESTVNNQEDE